MRQLLPLLAVSALVLSTAPAYADLGDQLFKLLPDDGAAIDQFGYGVAISGITAIVGAGADDNENGTNSGSAYLFDTTTGAQIAKLLPDDGAADDYFGFVRQRLSRCQVSRSVGELIVVQCVHILAHL